MANQALSILIVDSPAPAETDPIIQALNEQGFVCESAPCPDSAETYLDKLGFDAVIVHQRAVGDRLGAFVESARGKNMTLAIIAVQSEYDGPQECDLFDLDADDVVTLEYSPAMLALRAAIRTRNRLAMKYP